MNILNQNSTCGFVRYTVKQFTDDCQPKWFKLLKRYAFVNFRIPDIESIVVQSRNHCTGGYTTRVYLLFLYAFIAMIMLAGCNKREAGAPAPGSASDGVDLAGMDRAVNPGDDFFRYANGNWLKSTEIPADRSNYGLFSRLAEEANLRTRDLLGQATKAGAQPEPDERKAADYFAAYMDEEAIEKKGLEPIRTELDRIAAISTRTGIVEALAKTIRADVDPLNNTNLHTQHLFGIWVAQDFNEPSRCVPYLLQGGLGMPDREYYIENSPRMADIRASYKTHIAAVLNTAKIANAEAMAGRIFDLETKIARAHWSRSDSEDVHKANNPWKREDFAAKAPGLDWRAFFKAAELDDQAVIVVWQASAIAGEAALVGSEPLESWKDYLAYQLLDGWSYLLPKAFVEEKFAFYGKVLAGTPQLRERWKRAVDSTNYYLGDAVGRLYVQHYFSSEAKAKAEKMVSDLVQAFGRRIDNLTWMTPQTKAKAREKLSTLKVGVGYPDKWRDYPGLEISRDKPLQNALAGDLYLYQQSLSKLRKPVDRSEWWMTPQTVNAVNLPVQNALNFPAAILQPPYFDPNADAAINYGAIGAVIGHEISHSFDDQGSQFDASGKLANWWTPEDLAHFQQAANRLVAQYDAYHPLPDLSVNGRQTLSENIADIAGLSVAFDGYRLSIGGKTVPVRQGLAGDQQFFISFAQCWREKYREPLLRQLIMTDGHTPAEYRADTVRNIDPWYEAFSAKPGQKLYLAPGDHVRLW
jgi:putative endopeptidase